MVAQGYNPSTLGTWGGHIAWTQEFETSLRNVVKLHLYQKYKKIARHSGAICGLRYLGGWSGRIAWVREVEAIVSQDCITALHPRWQSKTLSQNK